MLNIASQVQEGERFPATSRLRSLFIYYGGTGGGVAKGRKGGQAYALRKETTTLIDPPRPIIAPFWKAHEAEAYANIKRNFELKSAGIRITNSDGTTGK